MRDDWSTLRKLMFQRMAAGGSLKEYEAEGNPAVFQTNVAKALSGFTIPFLPVQQGTGDPSPQNQRPIIGLQGMTAWRTGANLLNINRTEGTPNPESILVSPRVMDTDHYYIGCHADNYYYKPYVSGSVQNGVITVSSIENNSYGIGFPVAVKGNQKYTINFTAQSGVLIGVAYYDAEWNFISNGGDIYPSHLPNAVKTTPANASYMVLIFRSSVGQTYAYSDIMVTAGETGAEYAPYTGESYSVVFPATGKNLLNPAERENLTNNICSNRNHAMTLSAGTYTLSISESCDGVYVMAEGTIIGQDPLFKAFSTTSLTFTLNEPTSVWFLYYLPNISADNTIQLEAGSTATAYEPYTNTVYGGTVYPLEGRMLVEYAKAVAKKTDFGNKMVEALEYRQTEYKFPEAASGTSWNIARQQQKFNYGNIANPWSETSFGDYVGVMIWQEQFSKSYMRISEAVYQGMGDDDTAEITYKLATPIEIPLDPITVQTLIGDNVIWTDTNGENTIKYKKKG